VLRTRAGDYEKTASPGAAAALQYDQVIIDASKKVSSTPEDQLQTKGVTR